MSRFAASSERKPSEVPSAAYNGICSRLEDTGVLEPEGKEFLESPVSRARPKLTPDDYQERSSFVNRKRKFRLTNSLALSSDAATRFPQVRTRDLADTRPKWICARYRCPATTRPASGLCPHDDSSSGRSERPFSEVTNLST